MYSLGTFQYHLIEWIHSWVMWALQMIQVIKCLKLICLKSVVLFYIFFFSEHSFKFLWLKLIGCFCNVVMFIWSFSIQQLTAGSEKNLHCKVETKDSLNFILLLSLRTVFLTWMQCNRPVSSQIDGLVKIPLSLLNLGGLFPVIWQRQVSVLTNTYRSLTRVDILQLKLFGKLRPLLTTMLWPLKNIFLYIVLSGFWCLPWCVH